MRVLLRVSFACLVLAFVAVEDGRSQDVSSAGAMLRAIYKNYGKGGTGIDLTGPKARRYFSSSLLALLRSDLAAAGDEPGALDGDPVCGCQDWDAIHDLKIAIELVGKGRARASLSFALLGPQASAEQSVRSLEMNLVSQAGSWRIDNILDQSDAKAPFDLRVELEKEIRTLNRGGKVRLSR